MIRAWGSVVEARASFTWRRLCFAVASRCFCSSSHSRIASSIRCCRRRAARSRAARWRRVSSAPSSSANFSSVSTCSKHLSMRYRRYSFALNPNGFYPIQSSLCWSTSSLDVFATVLALADAPRPTDGTCDGVNLVPYLAGESKTSPHERLYWRIGGGEAHAVREGRWKLVRLHGKPAELSRGSFPAVAASQDHRGRPFDERFEG
jgi:hypothetical protein